MGSIDNANSKFSAVIAAITSNPLFHLSLPLIAGLVIYTEHKVPSLKEGIAGSLLLLANVGRALGSIMDFLSKSSQDPEQK